jgi:hypothetical protein
VICAAWPAWILASWVSSTATVISSSGDTMATIGVAGLATAPTTISLSETTPSTGETIVVSLSWALVSSTAACACVDVFLGEGVRRQRRAGRGGVGLGARHLDVARQDRALGRRDARVRGADLGLLSRQVEVAGRAPGQLGLLARGVDRGL